jgi:DNA-binding NarL/FixJ family response regulator
MPAPTTSTQLFKNVAQRAHKVLIADDHDIFRHGLKTLLKKYPFINCIGDASNGKELVKLIQRDQPDLIFMDLHMPGGHGVEATTEILKEYPGIKIVVLSLFDDVLTVERMMKMGVIGYLTKNISVELLDAMFEKVLNGVAYICPDAANNIAMNKIVPTATSIIPEQVRWLEEEITTREKQVLRMTTQGMSQKQMAANLRLSPRTIETHKEKLMKKLGAKNTAELISLAYEYKLV